MLLGKWKNGLILTLLLSKKYGALRFLIEVNASLLHSILFRQICLCSRKYFDIIDFLANGFARKSNRKSLCYLAQTYYSEE